MSKRTLQIGPFTGLNQRVPPDYIKDSELSVAKNVLINVDGSISPRPGVKHHTNGLPVLGAFDSYWVLGYVAGYYLLAIQSQKLPEGWFYTKNIYSWNGKTNDTWRDTTFTNSGKDYHFTKAVVYENKIYFICQNNDGSSYTGGGSSTFVTAGYNYLKFTDLSGFTTISGTPRYTNTMMRDLVHIWRDRLFLVGAQKAQLDGPRVYYSKATDFTNFTAPDGGYFALSGATSGESLTITDSELVNEVLYIATTEGLYHFTYQADPATDGYLRKVYDGMVYTVCSWNNRIFIHTPESVYEFVNGQVVDIAYNLNLAKNDNYYSIYQLTFGTTIPITRYKTMHVMGNYLFLSPSVTNSYANGRGYIYNLYNGAWTEWSEYDTNFIPQKRIEPSYNSPNMFICETELNPTAPWIPSFQNSVIMVNFDPPSGYFIVNAKTSDPNYEFNGDYWNYNKRRMVPVDIRTKHFKFTFDTQYKKVYGVKVSKGYQGGLNYPAGYLDIDIGALSGFRVKFSPNYDDILSSGEMSNTITIPPKVDYGLLPNTKFRCSQFYLQYLQDSTGIADGDLVNCTANFRINYFLVDLDAKSNVSDNATLG